MFILQKIKKAFDNLLKFNKLFKNTIYISIGENCLTDNILARYHLKSFSTPYSHGRSNIDYAIQLEKENYKNLLNPTFIKIGHINSKEVQRNKYYRLENNIYKNMHQNGFEFTHHDIINNPNHLLSYKRKVERMKKLSASRKKIKFFYHHRANSNADLNLIISKARFFLKFYENTNCEFILFTQKMISDINKRSLHKFYNSINIKGYVFYCMSPWEGNDPKKLWALNDDDLIASMIYDVKKY